MKCYNIKDNIYVCDDKLSPYTITLGSFGLLIITVGILIYKLFCFIFCCKRDKKENIEIEDEKKDETSEEKTHTEII